jgi:hypothetical protein
MELKSISDLVSLKNGHEGYLDLYPNSQKTNFLPFSIARLLWLVKEIQKQTLNADK